MVKLKVVYEKYDRFDEGSLRSATISGETLKEALLKMIDRMSLYVDRDSVSETEEDENREVTAEEIIKEIESYNGDGCDYIILLKDLVSGKIYIKEDYEEESWDD